MADPSRADADDSSTALILDMADPGGASQGLGALLGELAAFGLAIGFSPLHISLLLLLLLGPRPLQRGSWFVVGWLITAALAVILLTTVGHGLFLSMDKGSSHRTGLDLLAAGALLGLGLKQLLANDDGGSEPPGWTRKLEQFCARPLPLLERGKQWLFANGTPLVGLVGVALGVYLGWQGIEGLRLG